MIYIFFQGTQSAWNKFIKSAVKAAAFFIGMAVGAKSEIPKVGQAMTNILKSITGGRVLFFYRFLRKSAEIIGYLVLFETVSY